MHKKKFYSLTILLCILIPITITANPVSLTGKRYFNVSYGLSQQEKNDNEVSLARLTMNIPITRKLDLSFGTFQGWMDETINENNIKTQHDYSFYINSKYHFLPQSIINPFVIIEMGQVINNINFIGASSKHIEMMGDKIQAKRIAKENGLPVIEGSEGGVKDVSEAKELCKKIGFPVLIKASGGGGGKGMKIVYKEEEFETMFSTAKIRGT